MSDAKAAQRNEAMRLTKSLTSAQKTAADAIICQKVLTLQAYQSAESLFCYVSMGDEIDTMPILKAALAAGKTLCVPLCVGKGVMHAKRIESLAALKRGQFGILEPSVNAPLILPQAIDFAILPCLAADEKGARLGHGAGYYDRYLPQMRADAYTAVLCRRALLMTVEQMPHDISANCTIND